jgi:hypothetical protein
MVDMDDDRDLEIGTIALTVWTPELKEDGPQMAPDPERPPVADRTVLRLKICLAVAVAAAVALAGTLYVVRFQSTEERLVEEAVAAYTKAWNAHDAAAVRKAMSDNGTFAASDNLLKGVLFTAYVGPELESALGKLFAANATIETTSKVLISGDNPDRASVAQRFSYTVYGLPVNEDGLSQFTLTKGPHGKLVIAQHVFWRPWAPGSPSMLWLLEKGPA